MCRITACFDVLPRPSSLEFAVSESASVNVFEDLVLKFRSVANSINPAESCNRSDSFALLILAIGSKGSTAPTITTFTVADNKVYATFAASNCKNWIV